VVAKTRALAAPPVASQALFSPWVAAQVPLAANENSPGNAGGIFPEMLCHVVPSVVRISGNTPFTESLCEIPRFGVQNAKQS
jgi:hypothetical protein